MGNIWRSYATFARLRLIAPMTNGAVSLPTAKNLELNVKRKKLAHLIIARLTLWLPASSLSLAGMASYWSPFARHLTEDAAWSTP